MEEIMKKLLLIGTLIFFDQIYSSAGTGADASSPNQNISEQRGEINPFSEGMLASEKDEKEKERELLKNMDIDQKEQYLKQKLLSRIISPAIQASNIKDQVIHNLYDRNMQSYNVSLKESLTEIYQAWLQALEEKRAAEKKKEIDTRVLEDTPNPEGLSEDELVDLLLGVDISQQERLEDE